MDRRLVYVAFAPVATFLLFFAIGYDGWNCEGSILTGECQKEGAYKLTGVLLLAANFAILLAGIFLILLTACKFAWSATVACILAVISDALSITGMAFYANALNYWSPFIATAAMTLMFALSGILVLDLASKY
ncbi:unnamed protein product [Taenia asiatica]|uniref:Expressed conserved protein n=1 Tax=Taenia asiatica TaxID=60517 RepID=A0A0R3VXG4_TAEAS|nr:unnamed protein product [Taenia asiatica]